MYLAQICLVTLGCRLDRLIAWIPVCRAYFAILVCELECIDESQRLVDATANG